MSANSKRDLKTESGSSSLEIMRHSAAHVMAEAVQGLFSDAHFGIGPAIENGFYYDFELPRPLKPEELPQIEEKMREIIARNLPFSREEVSKDEARKLFAGQPYKLELIAELAEETVTVYRQGGFIDLCRGPHLNTTDEIKAFKLVSIAGAYWRGDEHRPMLQRIYGVAFTSEADLKDYIEKMDVAARSDHRKLGVDLDLFSIHEGAGPGLVCWHPNGSTVRRIIEDFWKEEHINRGYEIVYTPHIAKVDLWKTSGHWDFYRENMYSPMEIDEQEYVLKPMNCLYHILIYKTHLRSYRDLPIRYAELGTVYRYERSGVLHGLSRVRGFTQDDAHIFCRIDQLEDEVADVLDLARFMMNTFGFSDVDVYLSTRPAKYAGEIKDWDEATVILQHALEREKVAYKVDPGEGAFYGPKIDIKFRDAIGRSWQGPTIQVDFNNPQRFHVTYIGEDGQEHFVAMVHRTVLGSMERFFASLIEHYGGAFPVWLAPVQVAIIPVADRHLEYSGQLQKELRKLGIRVHLDSRAERINQKIRSAQMLKVPYMLVVGDKEMVGGNVSVRLRSGEQHSEYLWSAFKESIRAQISSRTLELKL
jgi:threonyl-tRNA synthetase